MALGFDWTANCGSKYLKYVELKATRGRDACVHRPRLTSMQHSASLQANVKLKDRAMKHSPANFSSSHKFTPALFFNLDNL